MERIFELWHSDGEFRRILKLVGMGYLALWTALLSVGVVISLSFSSAGNWGETKEMWLGIIGALLFWSILGVIPLGLWVSSKVRRFS